MSEGSLYDRELAALAIKQARGDMIEAIFLVRAYRTTLARFGTAAADRYRRDGRRAPHLRDLQGSAGRPGARPDLRLHPPAARPHAGRGPPILPPLATAPARDRRSRGSPRSSAPTACRAGAARHRHARRRPHPRSAVVSGGARPAAAESRPRRRGIPARARPTRPSAAMAAPIRSPARSGSARSRSSSSRTRSASRCRSAASR